ncbi:bis(5'-nucleosyl)-tetraphosphatase (symmetrical) YqeK [Edaphobacillus lindanitolerans]|uniref:bis(5'-nucleosyl)-tetraphosphatase (symmetrical) n=1 Tax=Edaphobacillus lindanitolerans TaxID=550447 RepID=A0A1U7PPK6_9BACI|nr:bis(5'-nucleosyl)-tetraphosphatase (symmetrical) YqeK [Edaphobacillus lindanitolerans]SIT82578.1 putative HD superfamily hydrolase of NAD metabolism [Edaphobacillus lindanitolerans]
MDPEKLKAEVKRRLPEGRFRHVLRVADTAVEMAVRFGADPEDARTAALLHDVAKAMPKEELRELVLSEGDPAGVLGFHHELWHAPAGAIIAEREFGISGGAVLDAIRFHTTGRAGMGVLEQIIYVADMTEPGRDFPGAEELRQESLQSLSGGLTACSAHTIRYLAGKRAQIHPETLACYNDSLHRKDMNS